MADEFKWAALNNFCRLTADWKHSEEREGVSRVQDLAARYNWRAGTFVSLGNQVYSDPG